MTALEEIKQKAEDAKLFVTVLTDYILDKKEVSEC